MSSSVNGAMDYRGIDVSVPVSNNPTISGFMKYKGTWNANLDYYIDDYVVYNNSSYIAVADSVGNEPDNYPLIWEVVAYWSNPNNVSNFRGNFAPLVTLQQYDSIQDPNTRATYIYLGTSRYTTTTIQDLINNCARLQNAPQLQQQLQTPSFFGYTGNGTSSTGGLLFPFNTDPRFNIIQTDLDIQTRVVENGFARSGSGAGTTTILTGNGTYGKTGWYKVSCSVIMWIYQNPNGLTGRIYQGAGYLQILKIGANQSREIVVRNQVAGPFFYNDEVPYYPATMHLEGIVELNFNEGVTLNCTNVSLMTAGWAIAPTMTITYLGPSYDPII
jgi:hypothetical protein